MHPNDDEYKQFKQSFWLWFDELSIKDKDKFWSYKDDISETNYYFSMWSKINKDNYK